MRHSRGLFHVSLRTQRIRIRERGYGRYAPFDRQEYRTGPAHFSESSTVTHSRIEEYYDQGKFNAGLQPRIWSSNNNAMPNPSSFSPPARMPSGYHHQNYHNEAHYEDTAFTFPPHPHHPSPDHRTPRNHPLPYRNENPLAITKPPTHSAYNMPNREHVFAASHSRSPRKPFQQHSAMPYPKLTSPPVTPPTKMSSSVEDSNVEKQSIQERSNDPVKGMPDTKESLLGMMDNVDQNIAKIEEEIDDLKISESELRNRLEELHTEATHENKENDDNILSRSMMQMIREKAKPTSKAEIIAEKLGLDNYELIRQIYDENKAKASISTHRFSKLNFNHAGLTTMPLYNQPSDLVFYHRNIHRHRVFRHKLIKCLRAQKMKEINAQKQHQTWFDKEHQTWQKRVDKLESNPRRKARMTKLRGFHEREFPEIKKQREQQERLSRFGSRKGWPGAFARSEAELEEIVDNLSEMEASEKQMYLLAVDPPQRMTKLERRVSYTNHNGLIRDVPSFELCRRSAKVWSIEEKEIYHARYSQQPKNFIFISNSLGNKSVSDCVLYYYLNKKKKKFKSLLRKSMKKRKLQKQEKQLNATASDGGNKHRLKEKQFEDEDENEALEEEADGDESEVSGPPPDDGNVSVASPLANDVSSDALSTVVTNECISPIATSVIVSYMPAVSDTSLLSPSGESTLSVEELISRHLAKKSEHVDPSRWSETEMAKAVEGLKRFGRNWAAVSLLVHTKSEAQCKNFYSNYKRKFNLESILGKSNQQDDDHYDSTKHNVFAMPDGTMPQLVSTKRPLLKSQHRPKEVLRLSTGLSASSTTSLPQPHPFSYSCRQSDNPQSMDISEEDSLPPPPPLRAPNNSTANITKRVVQSTSPSRMLEINLQSEIPAFKRVLDATLQSQADLRHRNSPMSMQYQDDIGRSSMQGGLPTMYQPPNGYQGWQFRNNATTTRRPPIHVDDYSRLTTDSSHRLHSSLSLSPRGFETGPFSSHPHLMNEREQFGMFHSSYAHHGGAPMMSSTQRLRTVSEIYERAANVPELIHSRPSSAPSPMNNLFPGDASVRALSKHQTRPSYLLSTDTHTENKRTGIVSGIAPRQSLITSITGNALSPHTLHSKYDNEQLLSRQMFRPWDGSNSPLKSDPQRHPQFSRSSSDFSVHCNRIKHAEPNTVGESSCDTTGRCASSSDTPMIPFQPIDHPNAEDRSDSETLSADENYQYSSSEEEWPIQFRTDTMTTIDPVVCTPTINSSQKSTDVESDHANTTYIEHIPTTVDGSVIVEKSVSATTTTVDNLSCDNMLLPATTSHTNPAQITPTEDNLATSTKSEIVNDDDGFDASFEVEDNVKETELCKGGQSEYNTIPISPPESPKRGQVALTPDLPLAESSVSLPGMPISSLTMGTCITASYPMTAFPYSSLSFNVNQKAARVVQKESQSSSLSADKKEFSEQEQINFLENTATIQTQAVDPLTTELEADCIPGEIDNDCLLKYEPLSDNES